MDKSQTHQVSVDSAKSWRQEAEALDRSQNHLNKIDGVIAESSKGTENISLGQRDYQAMEKDRSDFRELQQQELENSQGYGLRKQDEQFLIEEKYGGERLNGSLVADPQKLMNQQNQDNNQSFAANYQNSSSGLKM